MTTSEKTHERGWNVRGREEGSDKVSTVRKLEKTSSEKQPRVKCSHFLFQVRYEGFEILRQERHWIRRGSTGTEGDGSGETPGQSRSVCGVRG